MALDRITRNDNASVTIDLMFAVVLVISAMIGALMVMPNISHEDRDWRIKQYMTATRATDNLVQNVGEPEWEEKWNSTNYSNVTNIGLVYSVGDQDTAHKVLDEEKVKAFMGSGYYSSGIMLNGGTSLTLIRQWPSVRTPPGRWVSQGTIFICKYIRSDNHNLIRHLLKQISAT